MTQFEILTLWISAIHALIALLVGGGQCLLIWYGLKLMQRGTERREEQSKRQHEGNHGCFGYPPPRSHERYGSPSPRKHEGA